MLPASRYGLFGTLYWQIREDWTVYRDWTKPGFRALAVHRFGALLKDRRRGVLWWALSMLYRAMYRYIRNHYGIELPDTTIIGRRFIIGHQSGIVIHYDAEFGDDCIIRQNVTVGRLGDWRKDRAAKFGNRVHIGAGAVIVGGVTIGDDVQIGPNAVVMTDVPAGATVFVAAPRVIQMRKAQENSAESMEAN
ncbi:MAG: serine acetyltransferase [Nitrospira sp.]|nr:MAG: serine acetyltransferase [Nitrospira sp.]